MPGPPAGRRPHRRTARPWSCRSEPGRQVRERLAFAQVGQHEQGFVPRVQLPPPRPDEAGEVRRGRGGRKPGPFLLRGDLSPGSEPHHFSAAHYRIAGTT